MYRGGVLVAVLCLFIGLVLGLAASFVPRLVMKIDPMKWIKPELAWSPAPAEPAAEADEDGKAHPREVELRAKIAEVQKLRASLLEREKPLLAREQEVQNQLRAVEAIKTQIEEAEAR